MPKYDSKRCSWAGLDPTMLDGSVHDDDDDLDNDTSAYSQDELDLSGPASRRTSWGNLEDMMAQSMPASSAPGLDSICEDTSKSSLRSSTTSTNSSMSTSNQSLPTAASSRSLGKSKKAELKRKMAKNRSSSTKKPPLALSASKKS